MAPHKSERLRFVRVKGANDASIWWPSLFYSSWKEMISDLSDNGKKAQAVMWFTAIRKQASSRCTKSHWVTLLGKKRPNKYAFSQVRPEELDSDVKDFFFELEDMEILYCDNTDWNLAKEEAVFLLEDFVAADSSSRCTSPSGGALTFFQSKEEATGTSNSVKLLSATNATNNTAENDDDNQSHLEFDATNDDEIADTDMSKYDGTKTSKKSRNSVQDSLVNHSEKDQKSKAKLRTKEVSAKSSFDKSSSETKDHIDDHSSSYEERRNKQTIETTKDDSPATPVRRSSQRTRQRPSIPSSPSTGTSHNSLANQVTPPTKCDQKRSDTFSDALPLSKRKIETDAPWTHVIDILTKDHGFFYVKGSGIVPEYYVAAEFRNVSEKYIQKNLKEGKDYFIGEDGLKSYAHERYGWIGEPGREFRLLKQKRQNKTKVAKPVHPPISSLSTKKRKIEKNAPWIEVFDILTKEHGFCYVRGSGINPDYYVTHEFKAMDEKLIQRNLKEGKDYFKGEDGLKAYAHEQFKWIGEPGREFVPLKRKRRCTEESDESQKKISAKKVKANETVTTGKAPPTPKETNVKTKVSEVVAKEKAPPTPKKPKSPVKSKSSPSREETPKSPIANKDADLKSLENNKESPFTTETPKSPIANKDADLKLSEKPSSPILDIGHFTMKERLEKALNCLNVNRFSKETLFDGSGSTSKFRAMNRKILSFLEKATSTDNNKSSLMYVCGNPGLGKTTLVNHCVDAVVKETGRSQQIYLNASSLSSADEILSKIADTVVKKTNRSRNTIEKALSTNIGKKTKNYLILVIDEIDVLIKNCSGPKKDDESALSCIFRWASDPAFQLALIGISNKIGSNEARLLHMQVKVDEELIFEPYTESDLVGIIQKRLGTNKVLVEEKAIVFASRKVAKQSGDAREILDIIGRAVVACKEALPVEELSSTKVHGPVVGMRQVLMAARESGGVKSIGEIIMELPQKAKVVLCVASALNQVSNRWRDIPLPFLKTMCDEATQHGVISENMSIEDFDGIIGRLEDDGLIDRLQSVYDDYSGSRLIRVGAQLEDVEFAIQESSLLENPFYRKVVEYVCKNNIEP